MRLDGKARESVNVSSGASRGSVLRPLLFILYTFERFHFVGNHIADYSNDATLYAVIPRPLSRPQVMESLIKIWQQSTPGV